jgi:hypothetical protein
VHTAQNGCPDVRLGVDLPGIGPGERVAELTWPLLLAYLHPAEAAARWERINADGSRVVIVLRPASVTGRQQVR